MVSSVARHLALGVLAAAGVMGAGVWLGHRLDPTWARRNAPLRRALPFPLPALPGLTAARDLRGHPWILDLRFPGCGADDTDVAARVGELARQNHIDRIARQVAALEPPALAAVAAELGLADSARAAADGLLDARHWLFVIDGAGWVRGAADVADDSGWAVLSEAVRAAAASPAGAPVQPIDEPTGAAPPARLAQFRALDQQGRPVTADDFAGHELVVDFIFTRCTAACPMLTARLAALRRLVTAPDVRFLSFSVDPGHDTPEVLRAYAARWGAPDARWSLLATDGATVRRVARDLGELVVAGRNGPDGPILHSDRFTLVDAGGSVVAHFPSADAGALRALAARLDAGAAAPPSVETAAGARLFSSLGCGGCHENTRLAPSLGGVAGRPVRLTDGRVVLADDRYLSESITTPLAAVVDGFGPTMPSYAGLLSDAELRSLVAYVGALAN